MAEIFHSVSSDISVTRAHSNFGENIFMKTNFTRPIFIFLCGNFFLIQSFTTTAQTHSSQKDEGASVFQKVYGTSDSTSDASGSCVQPTSDGGYIATGYISNFGEGDDDFYLVKTNSAGAISWTKVYGEQDADDASYVIQTSDGGYAIVGVTLSSGGENVLLVKTDEAGGVVWSNIYGSGDNSSDASASSIQQTSDGGYVFTGYISNYGAGGDDIYLVKTDSSGNISWTKTFGGSNDDDASSVAITNDGGYIISGVTKSFADSTGDVYLIKTDASGNLQWSKAYGSGANNNDIGSSALQTSDHGYIVTGTSDGFFGEAAFLMKTDSTGNVQWGKAYGTNDESSDASASSVSITNDGGYAFTGYISNFGAGGDDFYLVKTDANGDTLWTKTYGSSEDDDAAFLKQTNDGGFVIGGVTQGFPESGGGEHLYLVKTDGLGNTACGQLNTGTTYHSAVNFTASPSNTQVSSGGVTSFSVQAESEGGTATDVCTIIGINETPSPSFDVTVYPNPFSDQATVSINSAIENFQNGVFVIYDVMGREVQRINLTQQNSFTIYRKNLSSNIYLFNVIKENKILYSGKLTITD